MRALLAAILLLQAAPAQSEADKLEAALKRFGDRSYLILANGEKLGTSTLKTRVEKVDGRSVAVLEDAFKIDAGGDTGFMRTLEKAMLDRLRLISTSQTGKGDGMEKERVGT